MGTEYDAADAIARNAPVLIVGAFLALVIVGVLWAGSAYLWPL